MLTAPNRHLLWWMRFCAFITIALYTTTSVVWADGVSLLQNLNKNTLPPSFQNRLEAKKMAQPITDVQLPRSLGKISKFYQGKKKELVIHIQDAHVNEEAQLNIAEILKYFNEQHNLQLVHVEGAEGQIYPEVFSSVPNQELRKRVAGLFLRQGRLTGPEYLAIVHRKDIKLFGVEDSKTYEENKDAYLYISSVRDDNAKILDELKEVLENVSKFVFGEELRKLNRIKNEFLDNGARLLPFAKYLRDLANLQGIDLSRYPISHKLIALNSLEGEIDFEVAEKQTVQVVRKMIGVLPKGDREQLLDYLKSFREKKISRGEFYAAISSILYEVPLENLHDGTEEAMARISNVQNYLKYTQLFDEIDVGVFEELSELEEALREVLYENEDQKELDSLHKIHRIYQDMFEFSLTKASVDYYFQNRSRFNSANFKRILIPLLDKYHFSYGLPSQLEKLDQDLLYVEEFYSTALKRDKILIERAAQKMNSENQSISALVTGGFHTPGIEKYLREQNYSYIVVTPSIKNEIDDRREAQLYDEALKQKPLALEKQLLQGYFPVTSGKLNDPRYQLSHWWLSPTRSEISKAVDLIEGRPFSLDQLPRIHPRLSSVIYLASLMSLAYIHQVKSFPVAYKRLLDEANRSFVGGSETAKLQLSLLEALRGSAYHLKGGIGYLVLPENEATKTRLVVAEFDLQNKSDALRHLKVSYRKQGDFYDLKNGRGMYITLVDTDYIGATILPSDDAGDEPILLESGSLIGELSHWGSEKSQAEIYSSVASDLHALSVRQDDSLRSEIRKGSLARSTIEVAGYQLSFKDDEVLLGKELIRFGDSQNWLREYKRRYPKSNHNVSPEEGVRLHDPAIMKQMLEKNITMHLSNDPEVKYSLIEVLKNHDVMEGATLFINSGMNPKDPQHTRIYNIVAKSSNGETKRFDLEITAKDGRVSQRLIVYSQSATVVDKAIREIGKKELFGEFAPPFAKINMEKVELSEFPSELKGHKLYKLTLNFGSGTGQSVSSIQRAIYVSLLEEPSGKPVAAHASMASQSVAVLLNRNGPRYLVSFYELDVTPQRIQELIQERKKIALPVLSDKGRQEEDVQESPLTGEWSALSQQLEEALEKVKEQQQMIESRSERSGQEAAKIGISLKQLLYQVKSITGESLSEEPIEEWTTQLILSEVMGLKSRIEQIGKRIQELLAEKEASQLGAEQLSNSMLEKNEEMTGLQDLLDSALSDLKRLTDANASLLAELDLYLQDRERLRALLKQNGVEVGESSLSDEINELALHLAERNAEFELINKRAQQAQDLEGEINRLREKLHNAEKEGERVVELERDLDGIAGANRELQARLTALNDEYEGLKHERIEMILRLRELEEIREERNKLEQDLREEQARASSLQSDSEAALQQSQERFAEAEEHWQEEITNREATIHQLRGQIEERGSEAISTSGAESRESSEKNGVNWFVGFLSIFVSIAVAIRSWFERRSYERKVVSVHQLYRETLAYGKIPGGISKTIKIIEEDLDVADDRAKSIKNLKDEDAAEIKRSRDEVISHLEDLKRREKRQKVNAVLSRYRAAIEIGEADLDVNEKLIEVKRIRQAAVEGYARISADVTDSEETEIREADEAIDQLIANLNNEKLEEAFVRVKIFFNRVLLRSHYRSGSSDEPTAITLGAMNEYREVAEKELGRVGELGPEKELLIKGFRFRVDVATHLVESRSPLWGTLQERREAIDDLREKLSNIEGLALSENSSNEAQQELVNFAGEVLAEMKRNILARQAEVDQMERLNPLLARIDVDESDIVRFSAGELNDLNIHISTYEIESQTIDSLTARIHELSYDAGEDIDSRYREMDAEILSKKKGQEGKRGGFSLAVRQIVHRELLTDEEEKLEVQRRSRIVASFEKALERDLNKLNEMSGLLARKATLRDDLQRIRQHRELVEQSLLLAQADEGYSPEIYADVNAFNETGESKKVIAFKNALSQQVTLFGESDLGIQQGNKEIQIIERVLQELGEFAKSKQSTTETEERSVGGGQEDLVVNDGELESIVAGYRSSLRGKMEAILEQGQFSVTTMMEFNQESQETARQLAEEYVGSESQKAQIEIALLNSFIELVYQDLSARLDPVVLSNENVLQSSQGILSSDRMTFLEGQLARSETRAEESGEFVKAMQRKRAAYQMIARTTIAARVQVVLDKLNPQRVREQIEARERFDDFDLERHYQEARHDAEALRTLGDEFGEAFVAYENLKGAAAMSRIEEIARDALKRFHRSRDALMDLALAPVRQMNQASREGSKMLGIEFSEKRSKDPKSADVQDDLFETPEHEFSFEGELLVEGASKPTLTLDELEALQGKNLMGVDKGIAGGVKLSQGFGVSESEQRSEMRSMVIPLEMVKRLNKASGMDIPKKQQLEREAMKIVMDNYERLRYEPILEPIRQAIRNPAYFGDVYDRFVESGLLSWRSQVHINTGPQWLVNHHTHTFLRFDQHHDAIAAGIKSLADDEQWKLEGRFRVEITPEIRASLKILKERFDALSSREKVLLDLAMTLHDNGRMLTQDGRHPDWGRYIIGPLLDSIEVLTEHEIRVVQALTGREHEIIFFFGEAVPGRMLEGLTPDEQDLFLKLIPFIYFADAGSVPRNPRDGTALHLGLHGLSSIKNTLVLGDSNKIELLTRDWPLMRLEAFFYPEGQDVLDLSRNLMENQRLPDVYYEIFENNLDLYESLNGTDGFHIAYAIHSFRRLVATDQTPRREKLLKLLYLFSTLYNEDLNKKGLAFRHLNLRPGKPEAIHFFEAFLAEAPSIEEMIGEYQLDRAWRFEISDDHQHVEVIDLSGQAVANAKVFVEIDQKRLSIDMESWTTGPASGRSEIRKIFANSLLAESSLDFFLGVLPPIGFLSFVSIGSWQLSAVFGVLSIVILVGVFISKVNQLIQRTRLLSIARGSFSHFMVRLEVGRNQAGIGKRLINAFRYLNEDGQSIIRQLGSGKKLIQFINDGESPHLKRLRQWEKEVMIDVLSNVGLIDDRGIYADIDKQAEFIKHVVTTDNFDDYRIRIIGSSENVGAIRRDLEYAKGRVLQKDAEVSVRTGASKGSLSDFLMARASDLNEGRFGRDFDIAVTDSGLGTRLYPLSILSGSKGNVHGLGGISNLMRTLRQRGRFSARDFEGGFIPDKNHVFIFPNDIHSYGQGLYGSGEYVVGRGPAHGEPGITVVGHEVEMDDPAIPNSGFALIEGQAQHGLTQRIKVAREKISHEEARGYLPWLARFPFGRKILSLMNINIGRVFLSEAIYALTPDAYSDLIEIFGAQTTDTISSSVESQVKFYERYRLFWYEDIFEAATSTFSEYRKRHYDRLTKGGTDVDDEVIENDLQYLHARVKEMAEKHGIGFLSTGKIGVNSARWFHTNAITDILEYGKQMRTDEVMRRTKNVSAVRNIHGEKYFVQEGAIIDDGVLVEKGAVILGENTHILRGSHIKGIVIDAIGKFTQESSNGLIHSAINLSPKALVNPANTWTISSWVEYDSEADKWRFENLSGPFIDDTSVEIYPRGQNDEKKGEAIKFSELKIWPRADELVASPFVYQSEISPKKYSFRDLETGSAETKLILFELFRKIAPQMSGKTIKKLNSELNQAIKDVLDGAEEDSRRSEVRSVKVPLPAKLSDERLGLTEALRSAREMESFYDDQFSTVRSASDELEMSLINVFEEMMVGEPYPASQSMTAHSGPSVLVMTLERESDIEVALNVLRESSENHLILTRRIGDQDYVDRLLSVQSELTARMHIIDGQGGVTEISGVVSRIMGGRNSVRHLSRVSLDKELSSRLSDAERSRAIELFAIRLTRPYHVVAFNQDANLVVGASSRSEMRLTIQRVQRYIESIKRIKMSA